MDEVLTPRARHSRNLSVGSLNLPHFSPPPNYREARTTKYKFIRPHMSRDTRISNSDGTCFGFIYSLLLT